MEKVDFSDFFLAIISLLCFSSSHFNSPVFASCPTPNKVKSEAKDARNK